MIRRVIAAARMLPTGAIRLDRPEQRHRISILGERPSEAPLRHLVSSSQRASSANQIGG
jgi:hypothetical protein